LSVLEVDLRDCDIVKPRGLERALPLMPCLWRKVLEYTASIGITI
jgi:hypothetical protein